MKYGSLAMSPAATLTSALVLAGRGAQDELGAEDRVGHPSQFPEEDGRLGVILRGDIQTEQGLRAKEDSEETVPYNTDGTAGVWLVNPAGYKGG